MGHARIGRVRFKDSAEIIPLRKGVDLRNDRRANFVNHVAKCFDSYVLKHGEMPDAIVLTLGGLKQSANTFWAIRGDSEGGAMSMLAISQAAIQAALEDFGE